MDLSRCAIHTITNKPWSLAQCADAYQRAGIGGICVWRNALEGMELRDAARIIRESKLKVPSLVRGGFFVGKDQAEREASIKINQRCVDEAEAIGADMIVLVVGAVPGISLPDARRQVTDAIARLLPYSEKANVKLAIEPLHPMYAADRSCINRMAEARQVCEELRHPLVGIAADVYHVWWDPDLEQEIALAGKQGTLFGFHVCDWRVNMRHLLNDRGLMGDGVINIPQIRSWVETAGFTGLVEVEVFSDEYWGMDQGEYLEKIKTAFVKFV